MSRNAVITALFVLGTLHAQMGGVFPPAAGGGGGGGGQYSSASAGYTVGTVFFAPGGGQAATATESQVQAPAPVSGSVGNLVAKLSAAPGAGNTIVFTFRKAAADTTSTCTITGASATTCTDSHTFSVNAGDLLDIKAVVSGGTVTAGVTLLWSLPGVPGATGSVGATGPGYLATSASSLVTASSGSKSFATQTGLAYAVGARIRATSVGTGEYMEGLVTSYSGSTLVATMDVASGTGTHADWNINLAGVVGTVGQTGPTGPGYLATSTSSLVTAASGSKSFTTQAGLAYTIGARIRATSAGTGEYMEGVVTSYSGTSLVATMDSASGSGSHTDWNLNVAGNVGSVGATGGNGPAGPGYLATSTTSLATGASGSKSFTTQTGLAYTAGARVRATSAGTAEYMEGLVTSYSGSTLIATMDTASGSGTHSDWNLNLAGNVGGTGGGGAINSQTANYPLTAADSSKIVSFNGSNLTASLPGTPPAQPWIASVRNENATALTVSRNGNTINGGTSNISLLQWQQVTCASDGVSNYKCDPPLTAGVNCTLTPGTNALTINCTGGGGGGLADPGGNGLVKRTALNTTTPAAAGTDYSAPGTSETTSGNRIFTGILDASGATRTAPLLIGTSLPGTCTTGDLFFKTNATAGQNIYECTATNTWTQQLNSGGSGNVVLTTGAGAPSANCTAPSSSNLAVYLDSTNQDEWLCTATNTWKKVLSVSGSGAYGVIGGTSSAPSNPSSGLLSCYFDSTSNTQVCLDASGNAFTMVKGITATSHEFLTNVDALGIQHHAPIGATDLPPVPVPTPGTTITLTGVQGMAICTASCTVNVPTPAPGTVFCATLDNNVTGTITFAALGGGAMYQNQAGTAYGTAGTGTLAASSAAGNKACLFGRDATHYLFYSGTGIWTAN